MLSPASTAGDPCVAQDPLNNNSQLERKQVNAKLPRILSVSSGRADVGILRPVWWALTEAGVDLSVLATGAHVLDEGAKVLDALPPGTPARCVGVSLGGGSALIAGTGMGEIESAAAAVFSEMEPDLVLVTGDRMDMLPAACATLPYNIPLAHLHGGEVTMGAVDDRIRHALTMLSHLHLVATKDAEERVAGMGEERWRISRTGAPGLDWLREAPKLSLPEFLQAVGIGATVGARLRLVTVHPETNAADPLAALRSVLAALDARPQTTLFTAPNEDPGAQVILSEIRAFVGQRSWAYFCENLGPVLYPNALAHSALMVGNSSSGIIESGVFGLPTINVGNRQRGRECGSNVVHTPAATEDIIIAIDHLGEWPSRFPNESPYGDGFAAPRIVEAILEGLDNEALLEKRMARRGQTG